MTLQIKKWGDWLRNSRDFTRQKGADYEPRLPAKTRLSLKMPGNWHFRRKIEKKMYYWHTGYMGHLKEATLKELFIKRSRKVLRMAVLRMLRKIHWLQSALSG